MSVSRRNIIVYDLETSGTNPREGHEIVQIGAIALRYQDYEIIPDSEFNILIKPQFPDKADPKAIDVIGQELWDKANSEGLHPKTSLRKFKEYMIKYNHQNGFWTAPIRAGFNNNGFDNPMLEFWMDYYKIINVKKDDKPWAYISYDLLEFMHVLFLKDNLKNNKLDTYAELCNVKRSTEHHDALEDCKITAHILQRYLRLMTNHVRPLLKIQNKTESVA